MKIIIIAITTFLVFNVNLFAADTTSYACKYKFIKRKDSTNLNSKLEDIMVLTINKNSTLYFSYLKQYSYRIIDAEIEKENNRAGASTGGMVTINANSADFKEFQKSAGRETEVLKIDFTRKMINVSNKFVEDNYVYVDSLTTPKWQIQNETIAILNQQCQKATTTFKGRNYTAWFASAIPYKYGPWFFNGLPGLILKVEDDKQQFLFECVELNSARSVINVFKDYKACKKISKQKMKGMEKLEAQDPLAMMIQGGKTFTSTNANGESVPIKHKIRPYNPIDLTQ